MTRIGVISDGPGSIGPGNRLRVHATNPTRTNGYITSFVDDGASLASLYALGISTMPSTFPGSGTPLSHVDARQLRGGRALIVGYYNTNSSGAGGFRQVMQRSPAGTRRLTIYDYPGNETNLDDTGRIAPQYIQFPNTTISWSSVHYSDIRPTDHNNLVGTYNAGNYTIDGYFFAAQTLRFAGQWITHEKRGGIDRWITQHVATQDTLGFLDETLTYTDAGVPQIGVTALPVNRIVNWPNMP